MNSTSRPHATRRGLVRAAAGPVLRPLRVLASTAAGSGRQGGAHVKESERRRGTSGRAQTGARVLVADDEAAIRLLCRVNLRLAGMEVIEATDGADAVALARSERPDLILLDVMMPNVDGWEAAAALAEDPATRDIPIVFLTARSERADQRRGIEAGAVAYVTKPFDPIRLAPFLERIVDRVAGGERDRLRGEQLENPGGV